MLNFSILEKNNLLKELHFVTIGSGIFFIIKLILVYFNDIANFLDIKIAYLLIHILLFFLSWTYHSNISFKKRDINFSFKRFIKSNFIIKVFDYLILISLTTAINLNNIFLVVISSFFVFIIRFLFLKLYVFR